MGQDQRLGIAKLPLVDLEPETSKEISVRLLPALDMLKIKDKKDRGTITLKVIHFCSELCGSLYTEDTAPEILFVRTKSDFRPFLGLFLSFLLSIFFSLSFLEFKVLLR